MFHQTRQNQGPDTRTGTLRKTNSSTGQPFLLRYESYTSSNNALQSDPPQGGVTLPRCPDIALASNEEIVAGRFAEQVGQTLSEAFVTVFQLYMDHSNELASKGGLEAEKAALNVILP